MQTSTQAKPRPTQPKQILLIGLPGATKSTVAMSFPNVYFLDADVNLDGPEKFWRKSRPDLEIRYDTIPFDETGKEVPEADRFARLIRMSEAAKADPWVKTIVYDGLSNISQYLIWQICAMQKRDVMEIRDWGTHKGMMYGLFVKQRATGKTTIMTCHREDKTRKIGKTLEEELLGYVPLINPGLQESMGGFFTDIWHVEKTAKPGGTYVSTIKCEPYSLMPYLKNSMGLPATFEFSWDLIAKHWTP